MMENIPELVIGFLIGAFGWLLKDKINGVKEIDQKLSLKLDDLMEMLYELKASVHAIEDISRRVSRLEDQVAKLAEKN